MEKKQLPPDFDWVEARLACSALKVFELLALEAQKNVETFTRDPNAPRYEFVRVDGSFSISRRHGFQGVKGVRFTLLGEAIEIEGHGFILALTATLTLNNDGECRLKVNGQELERWQVLRRALEPLLFALER
jgi:hypothetical protein